MSSMKLRCGTIVSDHNEPLRTENKIDIWYENSFYGRVLTSDERFQIETNQVSKIEMRHKLNDR